MGWCRSPPAADPSSCWKLRVMLYWQVGLAWRASLTHLHFSCIRYWLAARPPRSFTIRFYYQNLILRRRPDSPVNRHAQSIILVNPARHWYHLHRHLSGLHPTPVLFISFGLSPYYPTTASPAAPGGALSAEDSTSMALVRFRSIASPAPSGGAICSISYFFHLYC